MIHNGCTKGGTYFTVTFDGEQRDIHYLEKPKRNIFCKAQRRVQSDITYVGAS